MPIRMIVTIPNLPQVLAELRTLHRGVADLSVPLRAFGAYAVGSVKRTFTLGGRPTPWPPSQKIAAHTRRTRGRRRSPKTLIDTATLQNSIQVETVTPAAVTIGTNVRYAGVHQEGYRGTVAVPQHLRHIRSRDVTGMVTKVRTKVGKRGQPVGTTYQTKGVIARGFAEVKAHAVRMRIPARPFLVAQPEWPTRWGQILAQYVRGLTGR